MSDSLTILGEEYTGVAGIKATDTNSGDTIIFVHPTGSKSITANGTNIDVAAYATANVAVATGTPRTSSDVTVSGKTVTVEAGLYSEAVSKSVADGSATTPATTITANPTISVTTSGPNAGLITASVSASQNVTPTVSEGYVTSGTAGTITVNGRATSQLTVCGNTDVDFDSSELYVYGPSGYYPSGFAYEVSAMTLPTATSGTASGTTKATISRSTSAQYINIPTGYNSSAANYKVNATPNGTVVPQASISATGASVSHSSTTLTLSKSNVSNTPNVTTEGYISAGTAGNSTLSLSATDSNFVAGNIKDGVSIFGLTGNYTGGTPNLQAKTNISPTTSSQTITADTGYDGLSSVQINAMPTQSLPTAASSTATGTRKATIASSTSTQYINIPTGYNSAAAYYQLSAPTAMTLPTTTSSTSSGTSKLAVTPGTANKYINIPTGYNSAAAYYTVDGDTNLVAGNIKNGTTIFGVTGSYEGGGGSGDLMIATATSTPATASRTITFTGLSGEPTSFHIICQEDLATASQVKVAAVAYDGTDHTGQTVTNTSNAQASFDDGFSHAYSNGTLTVTATTAYFQAEEYALCYTYGGGSANIGTKDVQVGSGATSITFTGLSDEPSCWSCVFTSSFSTSSGYTRVMAIANDGSSTYGMEMGSGALATSNWTSSYSNGSLTITSQSTSAGGYFHQPGDYHLTYAVGGKVDVTIEPLNVTQNGTYAESGKAYSPVTVNVSGGSVQFDTKTASGDSTYPTSLQFTSMKGEPKAFVLRLNAQVSSSGSTTYYYIVDICHFGTTTHGNCFRIGSTRRVDNITSGYSFTYSGTTLTVTSSAASRSASPGAFYNGSYELLYCY